MKLTGWVGLLSSGSTFFASSGLVLPSTMKPKVLLGRLANSRFQVAGESLRDFGDARVGWLDGSMTNDLEVESWPIAIRNADDDGSFMSSRQKSDGLVR
jgi:hypothetical protein